MSDYTSGITFLYYNDLEKACSFFEEVLELKQVMDQGFAKVYQISDKSFVGCVKRDIQTPPDKSGSLVSLTVDNVSSVYDRIKKHNLEYITECKVIESIPLKSFFFKDYEGYDFEIQEFLKKEDKELF